MFMTNAAPLNGLDPGDRMPGANSPVFDEMDRLMGDWSWREHEHRRTDSRWRVYSAEERAAYEEFVAANPGKTMPALHPWSCAAYAGAPSRPNRIGG